MSVPDGVFGSAIEAAERFPTFTVRADWDRDGFGSPLADLTDLVDEVVVTRELSGSLPPQVGLIEGYATATLSVELSGTWPELTVESLPARARNYCPMPAPVAAVSSWGSVYTRRPRSTPATVAPVTGMTRSTAYRITEFDGGQVVVYCPTSANIVAAGQVWGATVQWRASKPVPEARAYIAWYGRHSESMGGSSSDIVTLVPANTPTTLSVTGRAPANEVAAIGYTLVLTDVSADTTIDVTAVRFDQLPNEADVLVYADGDTDGWLWDGIPGASTAAQRRTRLAATDDIVTVLSPYRDDAVLSVSDHPVLESVIECDTGFLTDAGARVERRFTGTVAKVNPTSSERTVRLEGIDASARLRAPITLPAVALDGVLLARYGPDQYRSRINTQWLIDYILRRNGIYASPPCRGDAILSVTFHGSEIPEVGRGGVPQDLLLASAGDIWTPGAFGMLCIGRDNAQGTWYLTAGVTAAVGTGIGMSMWLEIGGSADPPYTIYRELFVDLAPNLVTLDFGVHEHRPFVGITIQGAGQVINQPFQWIPPNNPTFVFVGVHVAFSANTMTTTWRIGQATYINSSTIVGRNVEWNPTPSMVYNVYNRMQNLQVWSSPRPPLPGPWQGEYWTSQADIDPGAGELTGIPELSSADSMALIKQITAAELASFGFSEDGRPWWRTVAGEHARGRAAISEDITADRNLTDLSSTIDEESIRNSVTVSPAPLLITDWQPWYVAEDPDQFTTPPGRSVFELDIPPNVTEIPDGYTKITIEPNSGLTWETGNDLYVWRSWPKMQITRDNDRMVTVNGEQVRMRIYRVSQSKALLVIVNNHDFPIRFATPPTSSSTDGQPSLIIPARMVEAQTPQPITVTDQGSINTYGEKTYSHPEDSDTARWLQWPATATATAGAILAYTAHATPVLDALELPHDPRRRIGQQVRLHDPDGQGTVRAHIIGLVTTLAPDRGATDTVTVRPLGPPNLGYLDDPELGLLDDTLILAP